MQSTVLARLPCKTKTELISKTGTKHIASGHPTCDKEPVPKKSLSGQSASNISQRKPIRMDRQLQSHLLIQPIGKLTRLTTSQTFTQLGDFLITLPPSPARTQLERLTDALGVEIGLIAPSEGERRETQRKAAKSTARAERRRVREAVRKDEERAGMEGVVEGFEGEGEGEEMEEGAVGLEGEEGMDEQGDVEYGDVVDREEDGDEPDNEDGKMDIVEKDWLVVFFYASNRLTVV